MTTLQSLAQKISLLAGLAFVLSIVGAIFFGVYFIGDTVTHLQFATMGGPLTTFIQHHPLWPPFFALVLNITSRVPVDPYVVASIFTASILCLVFLTTFLVVKSTSQPWQASLLIALLALVGPVGLILQSFISEPLFIFLWMLTVVSSLQFWKTSKEIWLIAWLLVASFLPVTRYLGIVLVVWFIGVLLVKLGLDFKKKVSYSKSLVMLSFVVVWIPLAFYLLRTKIQIGMFFPPRDLYSTSIIQVLAEYAKAILTDTGFILLAALALGLIQKAKHNKQQLVVGISLSLGSAVAYIAALVLSQSRYLVLPYIPDRYLAVAYPFIVCGFFLVGRFAASWWSVARAHRAYLSVAAYLVVMALFLHGTINTAYRLHEERKSLLATIPAVAWTGDLRQACKPGAQHYVVAHIHSRNWAALSYAYLCRNAILLNEPTIATLSANTQLISAYKIEDKALQERQRLVVNGYLTYFYDVSEDASLDTGAIFDQRSKFE